MLEDGAQRWLDLQEAQRREERQRRLAHAERDEAFSAELIEAASDEPLPPGALDAIRRYLERP